MQNIVYHGTSIQGLTEIIPQKGTHGKEWIYATKDIAVSACFITGYPGGDYAYALARNSQTGIFYICERFQGAFNKLFKGVKGSIYEISGSTFKGGLTQWDEEVVSEEIAIPIREIPISDNMKFLSNLEKEKRLTIKYFPEKIGNIPDDDEDLVFRAIVWRKQFNEKSIERFKEMHPHLYYARIEKILKNEEIFISSVSRWIDVCGKDWVMDSISRYYPDIFKKIRC